MKKIKSTKGITLVSLVITIIVLLILATVAISLAVSSDGIFSKAGQAGNVWNKSVANENEKIATLINVMDTYTSETDEDMLILKNLLEHSDPFSCGGNASSGGELLEGKLLYYLGPDISDGVDESILYFAYNNKVYKEKIDNNYNLISITKLNMRADELGMKNRNLITASRTYLNGEYLQAGDEYLVYTAGETIDYGPEFYYDSLGCWTGSAD